MLAKATLRVRAHRFPAQGEDGSHHDKDSRPTSPSPGGSWADTAGPEVTTVRDGFSPGPAQGHLIRGQLGIS